MYCWKCGTKLDDNARFCSTCGTRLDEDLPVADPNAMPEQPVGVPTTEIRVSLNEPAKLPDWVMGTWRNHMGKLSRGRDDMYEELVITPTHLSIGNTTIDLEWRQEIDANYEVLEEETTHVTDYRSFNIKLYNANDSDLEGIVMHVHLNTSKTPYLSVEGHSKSGKLRGTLYPTHKVD